MKKKKKIIIIGAGLAGMSAGSYLQMNGFQTEIFESYSMSGGLCASWKRKDFNIDGCIHFMEGTAVDEVYYPVPWAEDESISFLMELSEIKQLLKSFNFKVSYWEDKTEISALAFQKSLENIKQKGLPPLGLHLLMGENTIEKIKNMARNILEDIVTVLKCILKKREKYFNFINK